jgi:transcriptional regulator with XRE-family HTH domain
VTFGQFLRAERHRLGLSLRQLAAIIGKSAAYLSDVENGRRAPLMPNDVERIGQAGIDAIRLRKLNSRYGFCENCECERCAGIRAAAADVARKCMRPPAGWHCSRPHGHPGPCAATEERPR